MSEQISLFDDDQPRQGEYAIPTGGEPTTCRSCGTAIVWSRTPNDKAIPLDLNRVRVVGERRLAMNHFVTCPHGRDWRKA